MIELINIRNTNDHTKLVRLLRTYISEMMMYVEAEAEAEAPSIDSPAVDTILGHYQNSNSHWPYLISVDTQIVGFCLLRDYPAQPGTYDIDQFFVLVHHRRKGLGRATLQALLGKHPGNWLIRVLKQNAGALEFWINATKACVGNKYQHHLVYDNGLEMNFIRFST